MVEPLKPSDRLEDNAPWLHIKLSNCELSALKPSVSGNKGSNLLTSALTDYPLPPTITMSLEGPLPMVEAVERIIDLYNVYNPKPKEAFYLTTNTHLQAVDVFKALLHHAISPRSVATNFWDFFKTHFSDVLEEHRDPKDQQSLALGPRSGGWETVEGKLVHMTKAQLERLKEEMDTHAYGWVARLLLPSAFLPLPSPAFPCL